MAAEALPKKRRTRAAHKASATRLMAQIGEIVAAEEPDTSRLEALRASLKSKLETIGVLDTEIVDLMEDEAEMITEVEQADLYKETIFSALLKADKLLEAARAPSAPASVTPALPASSSPASGRPNAVRLPKLQLRHFNGDMTRWTSFWQSFEAAVDGNPDLSAVEKFNYLSSLLEGAAREAIAGLSLTEANYVEAVTMLKKRFGGTQQIVGKHMEALLQVEAVSNSQNVRALRRLFDTISSHVRSLASLNVKEETYGNLLCPILINKIPPDLQLTVSRKVPEAEWELKTLMSTIEEEIIARERLGQSRLPRRSDDKHSTKLPLTSTNLMTSGSSMATPTCCYCSQPHRAADCTVVTQVDARKELLRKTGRCFSCLRKGHLSRKCRTAQRCQSCRGNHHLSICHSREELEPRVKRGDTPTSSTATEAATSSLNPNAPGFNPTTLYVHTSRPVLLQTASAVVCNPCLSGACRKLRIVLDNGSQRSYLTQLAKDALRLQAIDQQRLAIAAFGSKRGDPQPCDLVRATVRTTDGQHTSIDLFVVPHICEPLVGQPLDKCLKLYPHLRGLRLADDPADETRGIDMLVGSDFYWRFVTGEVLRGEEGPVAIQTTLGWILSGPVEFPGIQDPAVSLVATHTLNADGIVTNKMLDATLRSFWELESMGVNTDETAHPALDRFTSSIRMKDNRYEVSLPWREGHDPLPTNYELSRKRLTGLLRRLRQTPEILKEYDSIIRTQLQEGIVELVREDAAADRAIPPTQHYLPHHPVIRQDKDSTKVRVVYDASSKSVGPSLNDCLHVGPKYNQRINELLFRFRSHPVALVADIERAFLMISVNPNDRDALRFLWVEDPFESELRVFTLRFTRVVFGVTSSPFLLNATIQHHLQLYCSSKPALVDSLNRSLYVDDVVTGADTEDEAYQLYLESKEVLSQGSFNLRKFRSNSPRLQDRIDQREDDLITTTSVPSSSTSVGPSEESFAELTIPADPVCHPGEHKVLGVRWEVESDQLIFELKHLVERATRLQPTKRNVVSIIGQIYDPLGYLAPVTISFKVLMQAICKTKLGWDQPLEGDLLSRWKKLIGALRESRALVLPRHYFDGLCVRSARLYGFCDASTAAYAAVVYLVESTYRTGTPSFVVSKTRVAPLKNQTVPRLELMSALLLARLITSVAESLAPQYESLNRVCYTDSQVALGWIKGVDRDWKPFVQNRVDEIRRLVPAQGWRHCPGKENPADIPSRGLDPSELSLCKLWKNGPEWLGSDSEPSAWTPDDLPDKCMAELKANSKTVSPHALLTQQAIGVGTAIDIRRFSNVHKLYRVTALVLKFIRLLKKQAVSPALTIMDITQAEELWVRESQRALLQDKNFPIWKTQFSLFEDERGLWRCGGRLQHADLPYSAKHPILLNKKHPHTALVVQDAHVRVHHNGVRETLTETRSKFWIIGGRSLVRAVVHHCIVCKRFEGKPIQGPQQPPLPEFRVVQSPPFTYTAVDYAGPLYVRSKEASQKVWICLFTCCASRAIHLEIVFDMTTTAFLRCMKRFAARRGLPKKFLSDNAKTFKSAAKSLKAICDHPDTQRYLHETGVEWNFNLEKAPWWGGLFERMIQSTKRCLRKIVGRARLSYDELHTAVVEIEAIVNSRPLSYLHPDDFEQPLTPSHLLVGRRLWSLPDHLGHLQPEDDEDFELTRESAQRRVKHLNNIINHFWKRWSREYLLELRDAHRRRNPRKTDRALVVGDIVVVHDQDLPRGCWKLAQVQSLITGRDGVVRGAVLKVASSKGPPTTLQRPLQLLYPLEISSEPLVTATTTEPQEEASDEQSSHSDTPEERNQAACSRPQRRAAIRGRQLVRERCAEDLVDHEPAVNWGEDVGD